MPQSDLGHAILGAFQDRIANFYKTAAQIVLNPIPLERAWKGVLGNDANQTWDMPSWGPSKTE